MHSRAISRPDIAASTSFRSGTVRGYELSERKKTAYLYNKRRERQKAKRLSVQARPHTTTSSTFVCLYHQNPTDCCCPPVVVRIGRVVLSLSHHLQPGLVEHQPDHVGTHEVEAPDAVLVLCAEPVPAAWPIRARVNKNIQEKEPLEGAAYRYDFRTLPQFKERMEQRKVSITQGAMRSASVPDGREVASYFPTLRLSDIYTVHALRLILNRHLSQASNAVRLG